MDELGTVVNAMTDSDPASFALATVVHVAGSTYRLPGARQLVRRDGTSVGTVSGGCLDSDVRAAALDVIETGTPRVVVYDLTVDDDAVWGWGLGCSGVTTVLLEPGSSARQVATVIGDARRDTATLVVATRLGDRPGSRKVVTADGESTGDLGLSDRGELEAIRLGVEALSTSVSSVVAVEGVDIFLEVIEPPPVLLVCGTGNDAAPLVDLGNRLGFEVVLTDERPGALDRDRFARVDGLVVSRPDELANHLPEGRRIYAVLMSHNFLRDGDTLGSLLGTDVEYIGLLGPAERTAQLLEYVRGRGIEPSEADVAKMHGPAGLDIGAEGPEQIAWSILAEIMAVRSGRNGGFLRERKTPIHPKHE